MEVNDHEEYSVNHYTVKFSDGEVYNHCVVWDLPNGLDPSDDEFVVSETDELSRDDANRLLAYVSDPCPTLYSIVLATYTHNTGEPPIEVTLNDIIQRNPGSWKTWRTLSQAGLSKTNGATRMVPNT